MSENKYVSGTMNQKYYQILGDLKYLEKIRVQDIIDLNRFNNDPFRNDRIKHIEEIYDKIIEVLKSYEF